MAVISRGFSGRQRGPRAELAVILRHQTPTDLPAGFGEGATELSEADRALPLIYSRIFTAPTMDDLREMSDDKRRLPIDTEFDSLLPDASEVERQDLAQRYAPYVRQLIAAYPRLAKPGTRVPDGEAFATSVVGEAITALYNPAQIDVLVRTHVLLNADSADN